ncbi:hypothetical protein BHM03_00025731 [Ensete ventricosum]|uniref:Uncharacterized protein n=1 Tax=Ensete ventricosum TaxID=4639 RepID=A0A445MH92_ENSVE|nr:hypothetical protein BHM03_00025731 [Ensete ventricosum]
MGKKTFCNMAMVGESSMGISFCNMDLVSESPMGTSDSKTPRMLRDSVELFKHWAVGLAGIAAPLDCYVTGQSRPRGELRTVGFLCRSTWLVPCNEQRTHNSVQGMQVMAATAYVIFASATAVMIEFVTLTGVMGRRSYIPKKFSGPMEKMKEYSGTAYASVTSVARRGGHPHHRQLLPLRTTPLAYGATFACMQSTHRCYLCEQVSTP